MKITTSKIRKGISILVVIFFLIILTGFSIFVDILYEGRISGRTVVALLIILPFSPVLILYCINDLYSFVIDKKGITKKLPEWLPQKLRGSEIVIAWDEMTQIGVGEKQSGAFFQFLMYFSKIHVEKIYFEERNVIPNSWQHFFLPYKEGLLEEVLKYVPEEKIHDVKRIKECSNPHQWQPYSESEQRREGDDSFWD